ncbi:hypothetical protein HN419_01425 [Candidatus Woesearchaeota archaeon]|jgi:hypothetical protein|nr:hypothetical protein [Candidatus Woesearchaeota archaeon]MBT3537343.1 hypothetical protein [Candidatus Woesearchaeota archaeon]MBT4697388.1 hypothetical protein [Candidatus Woesearchaeota archaeon]MBT4716691.1 hypothetical protein [Candidatus Woesearchaeota archaeon]MBT7106347.1 hypothetical protein [Candidatus Woesearchaeota archaeon]
MAKKATKPVKAKKASVKPKDDPILSELKKAKKKIQAEPKEPEVVEPVFVDSYEEPKKEPVKEKEEKLDASAKFLIAALIFIVVVFGVLFGLKHIYTPEPQTLDELLSGPILEETENMYNYRNFPFVKKDGIWHTNVLRKGTNQVYGIQLRHGPKELEHIKIAGDDPRLLVDSQEANAVYISFDPEGKDLPFVALAVSELSLNLARALDITPIAACSQNITSACEERPIISCPNDEFHTIFITHNEEPEVDVDLNCITIQGNDEEIVMATEKLILKWYGVME